MKRGEVYVLIEGNTYHLCEYVRPSMRGLFDCRVKMLTGGYNTIANSRNMYGPIPRMEGLSLDQVKEQFPEYFI